MNRREALRNIGFSTGYIVAAPTLISVLQSCQRESVLGWKPELLTIEEGKVLDRIVDFIIPETQTPGAKAVNVPMFIDKYVNNVVPTEDVGVFKYGAEVTLKELGVSEEQPVDRIPGEAYDALLTKYLRATKEAKVQYSKQIRQAVATEPLDAIAPEAIVYNFLVSVRDLSIWGYKTSEYIGENVLEYLPVPGVYTGCDSIQNLTGGKAWAL